MAKHHFSHLYGDHLENVTYIQLYFIIIGFIDPENMRVYTKILYLSGLEAKILPKTQCLEAICFGL